MRILLSCLQAHRQHSIAAHDFWRLYLTKGCEEAGIDYVEVPGVDWAEALTYSPGKELDQWRARTWEVVRAFVRSEHERKPFDFFLSYFYPQHIDVAAIREIQQLGIPCVNFFCDNVRQFRKVPQEYDGFDLHWVPEYRALAMYAAAKLKHLYAPMPCCIPPEQRTSDHPETEGITFIGSPDLLRRHLLGRAIEDGADIRIFGPGWRKESKSPEFPENANKTLGQLLQNQWQSIQRNGVRAWTLKFEPRLRPLRQPPIPTERLMGKVPAEKLVQIIQQSAINLGVNRVQTFRHSIHRPITYSRLRDIEAPMMGACYLTEWTEDLEHFYTLGADIETYRTPEELVAKIKALLADPAKRRMMRRAAQQKALQELSVPRSLEKIVKALSIRAGKTDEGISR